MNVEQFVYDSHNHKKLHDEKHAVSKIKTDPNYFLRYAMKHSVCQNEIGPIFGVSKVLTTDKYEMCCSLLNQFNSVLLSQILRKLLLTLILFFTKQPSMVQAIGLYLTHIVLSEEIIIDAIQELSPNSAAGSDGIPSSLLVNCDTELEPLLYKEITHSLTSGVVPHSFKCAAITPVGHRTIPGNYHPISLTSVFSKVLERIIRKQVSSFIDKKGFLNNTQHGFRSGRLCLSALVNVFDDVMQILDGGCSTVDMVYLNFPKAFDKVDHVILLHKRKALGINGNLGVWFYNFLIHCSHFVRLPRGISADTPVLSGVPKGFFPDDHTMCIMLSNLVYNIPN